MCLIFVKLIGIACNIGMLMQLPVHIQLASPGIHEWIVRRRENVRSWLVFVNTHNFKVPASLQRWTKRVTRNVDYFQSNYMFIFIGLVIYCLITSPLLFLAVSLSLGACYFVSLKNVDRKLILGGHEISLTQQFLAIGILSLPVFYWAGAGSVLFWVLGATFLVISIHATFYNIENIVGNEEDPFEQPTIEEV